MALIALFIVGSTDSLVSMQSVLASLVRTAPPLIIVSIAAGLVISCGEIDIASGSAFALTGMTFFVVVNCLVVDAHSANSNAAFQISYLAIVVSSIITIAIYVGVGFTITLLNFPALLSTLAVLLIGRGVSVFLQNLINSRGLPGATSNSVAGTLSLPPSMHLSLGYGWSWALIICAGLALWRYKSFSGLRHIAVGMSRQSAETAGVNVRITQLYAFLAAGALVAVAAHLTLFQVSGGSWAGNFGWGLELSAIAAAVIGGCRITGGRFDPFCIALGAIFVRTTEDAAGSFNLPSEFFYVVLGVGLLLAAVLDRFPSSSAQTKMRAGVTRNG